MERGHDVRPNAAAGMAPQYPRHPVNFRMLRQGGELSERLEKGLFRTAPWIEPQFGCAWGDVYLLVLNVVAGAPKRAVPLFCQRLPMQVMGGGGTFDGRGGASAVLMNDDAAHLFHVIG